jgi:hypothetical protein
MATQPHRERHWVQNASVLRISAMGIPVTNSDEPWHGKLRAA